MNELRNSVGSSLTDVSAHSLTSLLLTTTYRVVGLGKTASQSTTYRGTALAVRAVDGDADSNYFNGSVSSTNAQNQPWVTVS